MRGLIFTHTNIYVYKCTDCCAHYMYIVHPVSNIMTKKRYCFHTTSPACARFIWVREGLSKLVPGIWEDSDLRFCVVASQKNVGKFNLNRGQILVICSPYISSDFRGKEARARRRVFRCVSRDPPGGVGIAPFVPGHFRLGSLVLGWRLWWYFCSGTL